MPINGIMSDLPDSSEENVLVSLLKRVMIKHGKTQVVPTENTMCPSPYRRRNCHSLKLPNHTHILVGQTEVEA